ncbi:MAG: anti-sigma factor antagonist [Acutalibacteraceae bacterium]
MPVEFKKQRHKLTAYLIGDIDHHCAEPIRMDIDKRIAADKPEVLCLDFSKVTFMDSSGVGLVMGRFRTLSVYGGRLELSGMSGAVQRVMQLSGIGKIANIVEKKG